MECWWRCRIDERIRNEIKNSQKKEGGFMDPTGQAGLINEYIDGGLLWSLSNL